MKSNFLRIAPCQSTRIIGTLEMLMELYPEVVIRYVGESDMRPIKLIARTATIRKAIYFNPWSVPELDDFMLRWVTCHEFGHFVLDAAIENGYTFINGMQDEYDLLDHVSEFAAINSGRPYEVFAEIFAASILKEDAGWAQWVVEECYTNYIQVKENV